MNTFRTADDHQGEYSLANQQARCLEIALKAVGLGVNEQAGVDATNALHFSFSAVASGQESHKTRAYEILAKVGQ